MSGPINRKMLVYIIKKMCCVEINLNFVVDRHITINSLAIPDTFCSTDPHSGYQCPKGMKCMKLELSRYVMGFNGFDEFGMSVSNNSNETNNFIFK